MYQTHINNVDKYAAYYTAQAGGDLPGYSGLSSQYGAGLGGIFRGLFRLAFPLLKKGFTVAAPHLKTAAKNIVSDVITRVVDHSSRQQKGSGILAMARHPIKRPPGQRGMSQPKKRRRVFNKKQPTEVLRKTQAKRRKPTKRRKTRAKDIF